MIPKHGNIFAFWQFVLNAFKEQLNAFFSCFFWFSNEGLALLHIYKMALITLFLPSYLFRPAFPPTSLLEPCFPPCLLCSPSCFLFPALTTSICSWAVFCWSDHCVSVYLQNPCSRIVWNWFIFVLCFMTWQALSCGLHLLPSPSRWELCRVYLPGAMILLIFKQDSFFVCCWHLTSGNDFKGNMVYI